MSWHLGSLCAFDLETSGVDVEQDRIVTAAVIPIHRGTPPAPRTWLANPGIDIPDEATDVHGISTEHARTHGRPAADVIEEITEALADQVGRGVPIIGHNIGGYDLTLLDRECRRHGLKTLTDRHPDGQIWPVIDTAVLDKVVLPFRRRVSEKQGARQLITLAAVYGLRWDEADAHGCEYDALQAARVAWRIGRLAHSPREEWPDHIRAERTALFHQLAGLDLETLHHRQIAWAKSQAAGLEKHFRKTDPAAVVDGSWPLRPWETPS
ncbi:exonuclease domain-containing protein [Streptomyces sp. Z26]|uniref:exonuclease domain-containing protein n=1 Tax=Streptomyces sp. Z26 TaxID=2500177 RepID=UPI000EF149E5|nr:exonuclease domain-containing protein [Streptomyces sp. Z26]RLL66966.1 DNA polymerase III subunit epsilon [Streptomyces sp. Z26]